MKQYVIISRKVFILLFCSALVGVVLIFNLVTSVAAKDDGRSDVYNQLRLFTDVLGLVEKNYVETIDLDKLVEGSVKGMLITLDPHSGYMNRDTFKELQVETKGEFGGLGIEITVKDSLITVVAPIEDSPAYNAGIKPGDQIIKIGGEFTRDLSLVDAVRKMRGPKGSPITISVHRKGVRELLPITIVRDIIKVKSVRYRMLEDGFAYVRLAQFQEGSSDEFKEALRELEKKAKGQQSKESKIKGIVLDLRNNPGGLLNEAVRVSDMFLKDGLVVYTDGRLESQKQKYFAHDDGKEPGYPVVVLINGGSASASEIVAGALQDSGLSITLGTQSFGKGSVQTILPMDNGGGLRLTTALYFTRNGRSIQAQGITPDVVVSADKFPSDDEELYEEGDESFQLKERDLPGALKNPGGEPQEPKAPEATVDQHKSGADKKKKEERLQIGSRQAMEADLVTLLKEDPQLAQALQLVKTWHLFNRKPDVKLMPKEKPAAPA